MRTAWGQVRRESVALVRRVLEDDEEEAEEGGCTNCPTVLCS